MPIRFSLKTAVLKVLVFVAALMVGITAHLYASRSNPVLYRYLLQGDPVGEPEFAIFNPFRDRSPERTAEAFLEHLRAGNCAEVITGLNNTPDYNQEICGRESNYPLVAWRLENRTGDAARVRMYYEVQRKTYRPAFQGQLWVTVERRGGNWQVSQYESWY